MITSRVSEICLHVCAAKLSSLWRTEGQMLSLYLHQLGILIEANPIHCHACAG